MLHLPLRVVLERACDKGYINEIRKPREATLILVDQDGVVVSTPVDVAALDADSLARLAADAIRVRANLRAQGGLPE